MIEATSALTSEPIPTAFVKPGEFTVRRKGLLEAELTVYLAYGGTASPDDYEALPQKVVIPVGTDSTHFLVLAKSDELVEGTETVDVKITEPPTGESIYEIVPDAAFAEVRIADEDKANGLPVVGLKVVRGETIEPSPLSRVAPAEVSAYRDGSVDNELTVFLAIEGSATPDVDYTALEKVVKFAPGQAEVSLLIGALDDSLAEGDETVAILLTSPPTDGLPTYTIDPNAGGAKVIIHDNDREPRATIKITSPSSGAELPAGVDVEIDAVAVDPESYMSTLEFYVDGTFLDRSVIAFIRAPDPGTPIYHHVNWKGPTPGKHELVARGTDSHGVIVSSEPVIVVVGESSPGTLVSIKAVDPIGTELPPFVDAIDPIVFEVSRTGPTAGDLVVFFSLHGTASKDDYFEVPTSIIIPNGSASARLSIVPKSDLLEVVEPMETVGVQLEPSPMAGPLRTYGIDPGYRIAAGVIFERQAPEAPAVELVLPDSGAGSFEFGAAIELLAAAYVKDNLPVVDFYDGDKKIDSTLGNAPNFNGDGSVASYGYFWKGASVGEHVLTARAITPDGKEVVSSKVVVVVKDTGVTQAYIKITEPGDGQVFAAGNPIKISAVAIDPEGYIPRVEFFANDQQIGVSELAFFRAPDPGTPITHDFVWENAPGGDYVLTVRGADSHGRGVTSFPIKISVGPGGGTSDQVVLAVEAIDPTASETTADGTPDNAVFVVRRIGGTKSVDVPFTFSLTGTALNGVDYTEVSEKNILRAGETEVQIVIQPIPDKAMEGDEVIELTLLPPVCIKIFPPPPDCYLISKPGSARAVLRDEGGQPANASIELLWPKSGEFFEAGWDIKLGAVARDPKGYIPRVEFYANDKLIGVSEIVFIRAPDPGTPITHTAVWEKVPAGEYAITARGVDAQGNTLVSEPAKIIVGTGGGGGGGGDVNQVVIMVEAADPFAAETTDSNVPDPATFVIRRIAGAKDVEVPIVFKLSGDAVNGVDYTEVKEQVVLPAGADSVKVVINAVADNVTEPEEIVELTLQPIACPAIFPPPPQCYLIKSESARIVIRDHSTGIDEILPPKVAILPPSDTSKSLREQPLQIQADAAAIKGKACTLETSTDLKTWAPVAPVFLPDGQLTFMTEAGTETQRYYRLRVQ